MTELVLGIVCVALLGLLAWEKYQARQERSKLINAVVSKDAYQMSVVDEVDKMKPVKPKQPDLIPTDQLTDEEWEEAITKGKLNG